jgi:hypothetical protein
MGSMARSLHSTTRKREGFHPISSLAWGSLAIWQSDLRKTFGANKVYLSTIAIRGKRPIMAAACRDATNGAAVVPEFTFADPRPKLNALNLIRQMPAIDPFHSGPSTSLSSQPSRMFCGGGRFLSLTPELPHPPRRTPSPVPSWFAFLCSFPPFSLPHLPHTSSVVLRKSQSLFYAIFLK